MEIRYSKFLQKEVLEIYGKRYALNKWNGQHWYDCFEIDKSDTPVANETRYEITPIYNWNNCLNENNEYDSDKIEVVDYAVAK